MAHYRIGISGWRYEPWRKVFYPDDLTQARELEFASRALPTIEINGSFYSLQRPKSYQEWYDATPPGFVFSHKGNRFLTHIRRLREPEQPLCNVLASGVLALREKLGPFLWQFPPSFRFDADLVEGFLSLLPHDTEAALAMAVRHDERMKGRAWLEIDAKRKMRHAMEIRHESFNDPAFVKLLRKYKVALVVADTAGKWPDYEDVTADFMYLRLHGEKELYASGYTDDALDDWERKIRAWSAGGQPDDAKLIVDSAPPKRASRDIFCYFDNDIKVHAPFDARRLLARLGADDGLAPLTDPRG
ncbi:uncharacterized protein YecE (DUF72 family) [Pseudoduganella flava]|uniref:DUF72 domain-containing protein n=1 Tax=Pseudoduganella flava TaxID=871742 RepID=A0A562PH27_9BURK|nr:DUF72 domain-containing protein [Pseudoduganella flava]QGZ42587.1 DUF72 domain-containing protein [Pseudoduganella flava]TWI43741.1 uncharacterized protein YecE (DUF72 family) [Pseudoduganella flava]